MSHAQGKTDHSREIATLRDHATLYRNARGKGTVSADMRERMEINRIILAAAADLLEVHDATGISLDNWWNEYHEGPRELVERALELVGYDADALLLNHV